MERPFMQDFKSRLFGVICKLVGFLRVLRFPPIGYLSIFLVHSFWFLVVYKACLAASGLTTYVCAAAVNSGAWRTH